MKTKLLFILTVVWASANAMATTVTPFSLPWMNAASGASPTFSSSNYPDGIFVVEAYFNACPYCNANAANVDDLASKYTSDPRVHVLDVGVDRQDSSYTTWITNHSPNHPVLKDANQSLIGQLGTSGYPSTYVIDCKGNVVYSNEGEWQSSDEQNIMTQVDALLKQDCSAK